MLVCRITKGQQDEEKKGRGEHQVTKVKKGKVQCVFYREELKKTLGDWEVIRRQEGRYLMCQLE